MCVGRFVIAGRRSLTSLHEAVARTGKCACPFPTPTRCENDSLFKSSSYLFLSCVFCIAIDWSTLKSPFCWLECCCLNSFQPFNEPSRLHQSTGEAFFVFPATTQDHCDLRFPQEVLKINAAGIAFADLHAPRLLPSPMGARPERESFICSSHGSEPMGCRRGKDSERLCVSLVGARASDLQARCGRPQSRCRRL